jgi:hypothetical protein
MLLTLAGQRVCDALEETKGGVVEKLQYWVWLDEGTKREEVGPLMLEGIAPQLLESGLHGLIMDLDDEFATIPSPVPAPEGEHTPQALVSLWVDCYDRRGPVEEILNQCAVRLEGYQVIESLYSDYGMAKWSAPRNWPDGQRSPGILTVATFDQLDGTDFESWLRFWHDHQSPMSEAIQPRCRYVRNWAVRPLDPSNRSVKAIVEEAWPSPEHVTDPHKFFLSDGDNDVLTANVTTMLEHAEKLFDMNTMRSLTMSEWMLKTLRGS